MRGITSFLSMMVIMSPLRDGKNGILIHHLLIYNHSVKGSPVGLIVLQISKEEEIFKVEYRKKNEM